MQFIKQFIFGIKSYFKAIRFIMEHRLYWFILFPLALMLVIYKLGDIIQHHYYKPDVETMNEVIWYLMYLLAEITVAILLMKFAKYLVVVILSPLLSYLSVKTENILTGNKYPFNFRQLIHDIRRAMQIVVRNIMWEYFFFLIILIVSYFGWEDPKKSPVFYLSFAIGFYYYGFAFIDYINERRRLNLDESIQFIRDHRGFAIAIGMIYSLFILVPVDISALFVWQDFNVSPFTNIGKFLVHLLLWILASSAPILAIIAATIGMNDIVDLKTNKFSEKKDSKQ